MGIIINQSIKNTMITYLGFGIGGINTLFLYTHFLEKEYYGLVSYMLTTSNLLWPLIAMGAPNALIKFYSSYTDHNERSKLLSLLLFLPLILGGIVGLLGYAFYEHLLHYFEGNNAIVKPYVWLIFVTAVAMAYFELFFAWAKVHFKSVFGNFMKEVFHRLLVALLLLMIYAKMITTLQFVYAVFGVYVVRMMMMKGYAYVLFLPRFRVALPKNYKTVLKYSLLITIAGSVAVLMIDLDKFMIEKFMPIGNVAVYSMYAYIASVIAVPSRAMHQITYPLTAKLMNDSNTDALQRLYKKSAINLMIISGFVFLIVVCNVQQMYLLIPETYELVVLAVLLIGMVKLYDSMLGNTNAILFSSDYYRMVLFLGLLLVMGAVLLNYWLIPILGLKGAALATFVAILCYNTLKLLFVYQKFGIHPLSTKMGITALLILLLLTGCYFWDFAVHPILGIGMKSTLIAIIYGVLVYRLQLSLDINKLMNRALMKMRRHE